MFLSLIELLFLCFLQLKNKIFNVEVQIGISKISLYDALNYNLEYGSLYVNGCLVTTHKSQV